MSTGDIRGNIAQLERSLKHLKYPAGVDAVGLSLGDPLATLPILHFVLLKYSRHVTAYIIGKAVQLQGKTDEAFVKAAFKLFRDMGLKVVVTPTQFLEQGFAERKVLLLCSVVQAMRDIHTAAVKQERAKTLATYRPSPAKVAAAAAASPPRGLRVERGGVTVGGLVRKVQDGSSAAGASQHASEPVRGSPEIMWTAEDIVNKLGVSPQEKPKPGGTPNRTYVTLAGAKPAVLRVSTAQQQQQQHASSSSRRYLETEVCVDELVSAGLLPLQQQGQQQLPQQQQGEEHIQPRKPLRSPLWPQRATKQQRQVHAKQQQQQSQASPVQQLQQQQRQDVAAQPPQALPGAPTQQQAQRHQQQQQQQPSRHAPAAAASDGAVLGADQSGEMLGASSSWQPTQQQQQQPQKLWQRQPLQQQQQQGREARFHELQQQQQQQDAVVASAGPGVSLFGVSDVLQQQQQQQVVVADAGPGASLIPASDILQLQQQLSAAQAAVQQLQLRLDETQEQLAAQRLAAAKYEEAASARITVLEGRVRFMENQLSALQQQQQQQQSQQQQHGRSPVSVVAAALRSSNCPPAQQFVSRLFQQSAVTQATSPATIHRTAAPLHHTPLRGSSSAATAAYTPPPAAGGCSSIGHSSSSCNRTAEGCIDWRSAASAAAAAVVAGLAASPVASPVRRPRQVSETAELSALQDHNHHQQQRQQQQEGSGFGDVEEHASAAAGWKQEHVTSTEYRPGALVAAASQAAACGDLTSTSAAAAAAVCSAARPAGTGQLIDQLASRAVEAQQLLQALRGGKQS